jgi:hypothetical protein
MIIWYYIYEYILLLSTCIIWVWLGADIVFFTLFVYTAMHAIVVGITPGAPTLFIYDILIGQ